MPHILPLRRWLEALIIISDARKKINIYIFALDRLNIICYIYILSVWARGT